MKQVISVKVLLKSSEDKVIPYDRFYKVKLRATPEKGKANKELILLLANHFGVKVRDVSIMKGTKLRKKIVVINHAE